jgi:hypothetical protein
MLDVEDGLHWETFCDCSILWVAESKDLVNHTGHVTFERRRAIRALIRDMYRLSATD